MNVLIRWGGISAAAAALAMFALTAQAQAPTKDKQAPAATKSDTKKDTAKKEPKKKVVCKGMSEAGCGAESKDCSWIGAAKKKDGKEVAAYCRSKSAKEKKTADAGKKKDDKGKSK